MEYDGFMFTHSYQDLCSNVLNILEPPVRDPNIECVKVALPRRDKGKNEHFSGKTGERWLEFCDTTEVKQGSLANMANVIIKVKMGVEADS